MTIPGKFVGAATAMMGVLTVALLTGIVATAFSNQMARRKEIFNSSGRMKKYPPFNVIAYFGDQYGDFPKVDDINEWPKQYYMFPNPMYGKW